MPGGVRGVMWRAFAFIGCCVCTSIAHSADLPPTATETQYLSGTGSDDTVEWDFKVSGGRWAREWRRIPVPSNWEMQGFGEYRYGDDWSKEPAPDRVGEYRYTFKVPVEWKGRAVEIVFGASMTDTRVSLNGRSAGPVHQGGFYEFRYDVSRLLRYGEDNTLEVTVQKFSDNLSVNRAERQADFWLFGGIFRPVWLEARPTQHIEHVALDARHTGELTAQIRLQGLSAPAKLIGQVFAIDGSPVGSPFTVAASRGNSQVRLQAHIADVKAWSAEFPHRYRLRLRLERGGTLLHEQTETFGFRTIEVRAHDGLYVNGTPIRLKGVNRHTIWPTTGRATNAALSRQDIELIKGMNMNAVRMSHYPPDRHFLDLTDELGLYVIDELTGWQQAYDTNVGSKLVRELIERDVNHPSIILWANGNEGGWNRALDDDFALYDPQRRTVIHPWENFNGIDTSHYQQLNCCADKFFGGDDLIMPTEFLHALYDGGGGAGLDDWWNRMLRHPLAVGGFIWAFADEGIVRQDLNNEIDVAGNRAPDGVVGPYREKEGSYEAIRKIWSPVYLPIAEREHLLASFSGQLLVENRYDFTNLNELKLRWELADFPAPGDQKPGHVTAAEGAITSPPIAPRTMGLLNLALPAKWREHDALYVSATDPYGRPIYRWSWMLREPEAIAARVVPKAAARKPNNSFVLQGNGTTVEIDPATGRLARLTYNGVVAPLHEGPRLVQGESTLKKISHKARSIEAEYEGDLRYVRWRLMANGWLRLDYQYTVKKNTEALWLGVTFDSEPEAIDGMRWLGKGPYRVWKNRLKGAELDVWEKPYNDAITGVRWAYPEFKGLYDDWYWARLKTGGKALTMVSGTSDLVLRMLTPAQPEGTEFDPRFTRVDFPPGDISFLNAIAPIGTKFDAATAHGIQGLPNVIGHRGQTFEATVYFKLGD